MFKDKIHAIRDFLVRNSKIAFPVMVMVAVAVMVAVVLGMGNEDINPDPDSESTPAAPSTSEMLEAAQEVPLVANEDSEIYSTIATYYNALATGDVETLKSICVGMSEEDLLRAEETAKYIDYYPELEIYTKQGPLENSVIAYVYFKLRFVNRDEEVPGWQGHHLCMNEQGGYYINKGTESEEVENYIAMVSGQNDVKEFDTSVNVEYTELLSSDPELLNYIAAVDARVTEAVGVRLAQSEAPADTPDDTQTEDGNGGEGGEDVPPAEAVTLYATATTTVNVRSSDSEKAEKMGKVSNGEKVEVLEQRVNGWTKVLYEGKEGFIKSEYLAVSEPVDASEVMGTVTATTNVNVRMSPNETAERLGILTGGTTVDLLGREGDWCKVSYNGQVGYVKGEYVE